MSKLQRFREPQRFLNNIPVSDEEPPFVPKPPCFLYGVPVSEKEYALVTEALIATGKAINEADHEKIVQQYRQVMLSNAPMFLSSPRVINP